MSVAPKRCCQPSGFVQRGGHTSTCVNHPKNKQLVTQLRKEVEAMRNMARLAWHGVSCLKTLNMNDKCTCEYDAANATFNEVMMAKVMARKAGG